MRKDDIRNISDACAYQMNCVLATVDSLSSQTSRTKKALERELNFAQRAYNSMVSLGLAIDSRALSVRDNHGGSVFDYSCELEERYNLKKFKNITEGDTSPFKSPELLLSAFYEHAITSSEVTKIGSERERQQSIANAAKQWLQGK